MVLDKKKYVLSENNYIREETNKTQIVIGHTFNDQMRHFIGWQNRYNGKYKKTAAFTIDAAGLIYRHFDPIFKSNFFELEDLNNYNQPNQFHHNKLLLYHQQQIL